MSRASEAAPKLGEYRGTVAEWSEFAEMMRAEHGVDVGTMAEPYAQRARERSARARAARARSRMLRI